MATNCIVEIGDESGNSFKVSVSTAFMGRNRGNWRTIDKGFIRFNSGQTQVEHSNGTTSTRHVYLLSGENSEWGLRLNDFENMINVNDEGTGFVEQGWVTGLKPGRISWTLVS